MWFTMSRSRCVVSATVNGDPIEPAKTYRIVTNNFVAGGGDGFNSIKDAKGQRIETGILDRDALVDYLKQFKGEDVTGQPRIQIKGN